MMLKVIEIMADELKRITELANKFQSEIIDILGFTPEDEPWIAIRLAHKKRRDDLVDEAQDLGWYPSGEEDTEDWRKCHYVKLFGHNNTGSIWLYFDKFPVKRKYRIE